jgi:hypothetical protein
VAVCLFGGIDIGRKKDDKEKEK